MAGAECAAAGFEYRHDDIWSGGDPRGIRDPARSAGQLDFSHYGYAGWTGDPGCHPADAAVALRGAGLVSVGGAVSVAMALAAGCRSPCTARAAWDDSRRSLSLRFSQNPFYLLLPAGQIAREHGFSIRGRSDVVHHAERQVRTATV